MHLSSFWNKTEVQNFSRRCRGDTVHCQRVSFNGRAKLGQWQQQQQQSVRRPGFWGRGEHLNYSLRPFLAGPRKFCPKRPRH